MIKDILAALLSALMLSVTSVGSAAAQIPPPPSEATREALQQALQQQPGLGDVLRSRIRQSGLNADQIRARLRAAGYSESLLDAFLGEATPGTTPVPGAQELGAIQALGLPPITGQIARLDTGFVRATPGPPSKVFGVE